MHLIYFSNKYPQCDRVCWPGIACHVTLFTYYYSKRDGMFQVKRCHSGKFCMLVYEYYIVLYAEVQGIHCSTTHLMFDKGQAFGRLQYHCDH
jgi:hypothetical protein